MFDHHALAFLRGLVFRFRGFRRLFRLFGLFRPFFAGAELVEHGGNVAFYAFELVGDERVRDGDFADQERTVSEKRERREVHAEAFQFEEVRVEAFGRTDDDVPHVDDAREQSHAAGRDRNVAAEQGGADGLRAALHDEAETELQEKENENDRYGDAADGFHGGESFAAGSGAPSSFKDVLNGRNARGRVRF